MKNFVNHLKQNQTSHNTNTHNNNNNGIFELNQPFFILPTALRHVKAPHFLLKQYSKFYNSIQKSSQAPLLIIVGVIREQEYCRQCISIYSFFLF